MLNKELLVPSIVREFPPEPNELGMWMKSENDRDSWFGWKERSVGKVSRLPAWTSSGEGLTDLYYIMYYKKENETRISMGRLISKLNNLSTFYITVNGKRVAFKKNTGYGTHNFFTSGDPLNIMSNIGQAIYLELDPQPDLFT